MNMHRVPAAALAVAVLVPMLAAAPAAALTAPTCDALAGFAEDYFDKDGGGQQWKLSSVARNLWLPMAMKGDRVAELFGAPVLSWTPADADAAAKMAKDCNGKMKKAKRRAEARHLNNLSAGFGRRVAGVLVAMEKAERKLQTNLAALLAAPPSRDSLRAAAALSRVEPGGKLQPPDWRTLAAGTPPYKDGFMALHALRELPDWRTDEVRPKVQAHYDSLRRPVVEQLAADLKAAPETLDGLTSLETSLAATRKDLGPALTDADYAALDAAAAARREEIEVALLAAEKARLAQVPDGLPGLAAVNQAINGPVAAALSEARAMDLRQAAIDRRRVLADALVAAELARFDALPQTLDGLRQLAGLEAQALDRMGGQDLGGAETAFAHGVMARKVDLGRAAIGDFKKELAALPENEKGLAQVARLDQERQRLLEGSRRSINEAYGQAAAGRREEIAAAVAREEERLAALPLEGGVFADGHGNKFEFRDNDRVYMTMGGQVTMEAGYEVDGDRVILRGPQANVVMTRDGAWLTGNGLKLRRVAPD
ncbi:MAG: hypothetical protein H6907_08565 [Hyphomicrobiales bacterium]|nr:hypothetical protein [Hyphomicrobiales bacterium]MCP5371770.1 hypothetical protein [Hyphomicrobiales bacterium]